LPPPVSAAKAKLVGLALIWSKLERLFPVLRLNELTQADGEVFVVVGCRALQTAEKEEHRAN
jgi:hypothetical protein